MNKRVPGEANTVFAALKLIEQLYIDGKISEMVYRSIILENAAGEDIQKFTGDKSIIIIEYKDEIPVLASGKRRYIVNESN